MSNNNNCIPVKKSRFGGSPTNEQKELTLELLGDALLTEISSYLSGGEKLYRCQPIYTGSDILLAVALTASKSSWGKCRADMGIHKLSSASKAVLSMHNGSDWRKKFEVFDFSNAQKSASLNKSYDLTDEQKLDEQRLDDVDLKAVLICMGARKNMKTLKLTRCIKIVGHGLQPLVNSSVLQMIDLSLEVDHSVSVSLSENAVFPILRSILFQEGDSALRQIHFPSEWRRERTPEFHNLLIEYNDILRNFNLSSTCHHEWEDIDDGTKHKCERACETAVHLQGDKYGIQTGSCYECLKSFCAQFEQCGNEHEPSFDYCRLCQKYHCLNCNWVSRCNRCNESSCYYCSDVNTCSQCYETTCSSCCHVYECETCRDVQSCEDCGDVYTCEVCSKASCNDCNEIICCEVCSKLSCSKCTDFKACSKCNNSFCEECTDEGEVTLKTCYRCSELFCHSCLDGNGFYSSSDDSFICNGCMECAACEY